MTATIATTWIKPTYAHSRYNNKTTIKRKIDYIIDRAKTNLENDGSEHGLDTEHENEHEYLQHEEHQSRKTYEQASTAAVSSIHGYVQNPSKTENNELVTGYECFPEYADEQFATAMKLYEKNTGRKHKDNSRLLYHMRQSFKPGEVDPKIANRIGYELALEYTGGKHAFVVATHTDKSHIHNHVIFCAFNLECDGKFKDSYFNYRDVARISDKLCKEYELSVVEMKHGWSDPYNEWEEKQGITKEDKEPSKKKQLENVIALCLEKQPMDFNQLLKLLEDYSCFAKRRGKNISITAPFSKKPLRLISLSDDFTEEGIKKQIAKQQSDNKESILIDTNIENIKPKIPTETILSRPKPKVELRLIIDIQNSLKATESIGYKKWAEKFNLEQMSQTLLFIEKHELSLEELKTIATQKPQKLKNIKREIEGVDEKLQSISLLQRHIGTYGKTKEVYKQYRRSKSPEQFKQENIQAITDHEAARAYFDECGYGFGSEESRYPNAQKPCVRHELPKIKELREQYAIYNTDKKSLWAKYHELRNSDKEIDNAWANVKTLLNLKDEIAVEQLEEKPKQKNAPSL